MFPVRKLPSTLRSLVFGKCFNQSLAPWHPVASRGLPVVVAYWAMVGNLWMVYGLIIFDTSMYFYSLMMFTACLMHMYVQDSVETWQWFGVVIWRRCCNLLQRRCIIRVRSKHIADICVFAFSVCCALSFGRREKTGKLKCHGDFPPFPLLDPANCVQWSTVFVN